MKRTDGFAAMAIVLVVASLATAEMERVRVADDKRTFAMESSGKPFYVWGVN